MRLRHLFCLFVLSSMVAAARAQFIQPALQDNFIDTSVLRPPAGSKVAMIVFEDLGCPACARWHPYEMDVVQKTGVLLARHDYPLAQHIWTFDGAVFARYLEEKVKPSVAAEYRTDVFKNQMLIQSKDDLQSYNQRWMQQHGLKMPSVVDPDGALASKVNTDLALGKRLNLEYTPTIVVVTAGNYQVISGVANGAKTPEELLAIVKAAQASVASAPSVKNAKHTTKKH